MDGIGSLYKEDPRICVDYRELNKKSTKDAYPLPLPDKVQNRLEFYTILDLQCGYWQVPINPENKHFAPVLHSCPRLPTLVLGILENVYRTLIILHKSQDPPIQTMPSSPSS